MTKEDDPYMIDRIAKVVKDVGFPIAVAAVLLWAFLIRFPNDLTDIRVAIEKNTAELRSLHISQQSFIEILREKKGN